MADLDKVLDIPELTVDGQNWTTYQDSILCHYDGMETLPVHESGWSEWSKRDSRAKQLLATTIPNDIIYELRPKSLFENSAHYFFSQLRSLFEKSKPTTTTTATTMVQETQSNSSKQVAAYSLDSPDDRIHTRNEVTAMSQRDVEVSNRLRS
ncbi:hypothetical protein BDN67DRAFT_983807 [Paxillus ammoniavirescens]|nr:hypothetical protein BDN67DRAFT_983807 [Paxillus ammoniavirescens]